MGSSALMAYQTKTAEWLKRRTASDYTDKEDQEFIAALDQLWNELSPTEIEQLNLQTNGQWTNVSTETRA